MQATIKKAISTEGVGIHYNKFAKLNLIPAPEDTGILFIRTDIANFPNRIEAKIENIKTISLSTQLQNESGVFVATIEHLMSALNAFQITNLFIEISACEVPIMDGGSEDFCFILDCAGIELQHKKKNRFKLLKEIKVQDGESYIIAKPNHENLVEFTSNFTSSSIGEQTFVYKYMESDFIKEISSAKTIANIKDVETLQRAGMGLGGNLKNTLVFNDNAILNEPCVYNVYDFVKHKILDFLGDIYLSQGEIIAKFICYKSGHKLNHLLIKEILSNDSNYQLI